MSLEEVEEQLGECDEMPWSELDVEMTHCDFTIQTVRCAAHTLQLAVDDALKTEDTISPPKKSSLPPGNTFFETRTTPTS